MKIRLFHIVAVLVLIVTGCTPASQDTATAGSESGSNSNIAQGENTGKYWPTEDWRSCKPEAVGMNSDKLVKFFDYVSKPMFKTEGLLVVKNGYIVGEGYFDGFRKDSKHVSNSMAKSFTSALIGIAIDKGIISGVDAKLCQYYEDWDCKDADIDTRAKITIRHALTLTTGLEWHEDWSKWDFNTNDALKMGASGRFIEYMSERDGLHEPGQRFIYSTGDPMLLSKVIKETTGMHAYDFAKENLFKKIGIKNVRWDKDRDGYTATAWGLYTTVREFAKFGYLYLNKGQWDSQQIVSEKWVEQSTKTDMSVSMWRAYAYLWHINFPMRTRSSGKTIPEDGFMAQGVLGQLIIIIPSRNLVVVKVANSRGGHPEPNFDRLLSLLIDSDKI